MLLGVFLLVLFQQQVSSNDLFYPARGSNKWECKTDQLLFDEEIFHLALVADPDLASRSKREEYLWETTLMTVMLRSQDWSLVGKGEKTTLSTRSNNNGRSMELSELIRYGHLLLAFCDYTGLVWKVARRASGTEIFQRWALADGDGDWAKPMKAEFATVKDGMLFVGSNGMEWIENGTVTHFNNQWLKRISPTGDISNLNWGPIFKALRRATGTSKGYLWHEAVFWDHLNRIWVILPRKGHSHLTYEPRRDETCCGSNWLILANEDFSSIRVERVGPLEEEWGFTSVKKAPGTNDTYVALKVREVSGEPSRTRLVIFQLSKPSELLGDILLDEFEKFEGLEFL